MTSDDCRKNQQMTQLVLRHAQLHIMNMAKAQMMQAAVMASAQQAQAAVAPQQNTGAPNQPGPQAGPGTSNGQSGPGGQSRPGKGGQMSGHPVIRHQRAVEGQAAKPHRPQPPEGNQWRRIRATGGGRVVVG